MDQRTPVWTRQPVCLPRPSPKRGNQPGYEHRYCITSLPITHTLRRLGRRRWGTEPMFRDYKSAGWHIDYSGLQDPDDIETLLVVLSINYLWATVVGRWLCKSGLRVEVDAKKTPL